METLSWIVHPDGLPWWLSGKNPPANAGDVGLMPGSGRSTGEGNGNLLQHSCLENATDRRTWQAIVHGVRVRHDLAITQTTIRF